VACIQWQASGVAGNISPMPLYFRVKILEKSTSTWLSYIHVKITLVVPHTLALQVMVVNKASRYWYSITNKDFSETSTLYLFCIW